MLPDSTFEGKEEAGANDRITVATLLKRAYLRGTGLRLDRSEVRQLRDMLNHQQCVISAYA